VVDEDGIQERPPGFHMIPLPYADDIRAAPVDEALRGVTERIAMNNY
jgi:ATP-dependent DNA helicase 2 subunit 1